MYIFVNILLLTAGWLGGTFLFGYALSNYNAYKETKDTGKLIIAVLIVAIAAAAAAFGFSVDLRSGIFLLIGILVSFFTVVEPSALPADMAHETGVQAAREAALKEQLEEQKKREKDEMAENARIYHEAKKANEAKERKSGE